MRRRVQSGIITATNRQRPLRAPSRSLTSPTMGSPANGFRTMPLGAGSTRRMIIFSSMPAAGIAFTMPNVKSSL